MHPLLFCTYLKLLFMFFRHHAPAYLQKWHVFCFSAATVKERQWLFHRNARSPEGIEPRVEGWLLFSVVSFVTVQAVWRLTQITLMVLAASLCQDQAAGIWRSSGMPTVGFDPLPSPAVTGPVRVHYHFHLCGLVYWLISSVESQLKEQKRVHQHREKRRDVFVSPFN